MPTPASIHDSGGPDQRWVTNPVFCLLATMLAGTWLGWSWFAWNAIALGGERKSAQLRLLAIGVAVASVMAIGLAALLGHEVLSRRAFDYCVIALVAWKLWISYKLQLDQRIEVELYAWYGGRLRQGAFVLVAGIALRGSVLGALPNGWWLLVLS